MDRVDKVGEKIHQDDLCVYCRAFKKARERRLA